MALGPVFHIRRDLAVSLRSMVAKKWGAISPPLLRPLWLTSLGTSHLFWPLGYLYNTCVRLIICLGEKKVSWPKKIFRSRQIIGCKQALYEGYPLISVWLWNFKDGGS